MTTSSNESGNFEQHFLIASTYRVKDGFSSFRQENVIVTVDHDTRVSVDLKVGNVNETIDVTSETPLLQTDRSEISATYEQRTITELPILNRKFSNFELLTPVL